MAIDPVEIAKEMMAEVVSNAHAAVLVADVALGDSDGAVFTPGSNEEDAFECGVVAGYTETMRMLMRRGLLPSPSEEM